MLVNNFTKYVRIYLKDHRPNEKLNQPKTDEIEDLQNNESHYMNFDIPKILAQSNNV